MPLLKGGKLVEGIRVFVEDGAPLPPSGDFIVSAQRFLAEKDALLAHNPPIAVRLGPADDPMLLADHLDRINLVEVVFPKYTDGRGYSIAELLRRRLGYKGELRAVGQVLRDQINLMVRAGFDAMILDPAALGDSADPEAIYKDAVSFFSEVYQPSPDGRETVFSKRHRAAAPAKDKKAG
jgi:uncharacterized protein (DUF934 family)